MTTEEKLQDDVSNAEETRDFVRRASDTPTVRLKMRKSHSIACPMPFKS
jgi:hypothetical protein